MAAEMSVSARNGINLVQRRKAALAKGVTLGEAYLQYVASLQKKNASPNTLRLVAQHWSNHLCKFQGQELTAISRADCRKLHADLLKRGPTLSNSVHRILRAIISYAQKRLDVPIMQNPVTGVEFHPERLRRLSISEADLPAFWQATEALTTVRRNFWRVLLLSGLRRQDCATIRWDEVDYQRGLIRRPKPKGGARKAFDLPLTAPLPALLAELREEHDKLWRGNPFVFPSASKTGHIVKPLDPRLAGVHPQMCRRCYATQTARILNNPYLVASLLNHHLPGITSIYVKPDLEQRREGAERVAAAIISRCSVVSHYNKRRLTLQRERI
jgi:integrase